MPTYHALHHRTALKCTVRVLPYETELKGVQGVSSVHSNCYVIFSPLNQTRDNALQTLIKMNIYYANQALCTNCFGLQTCSYCAALVNIAPYHSALRSKHFILTFYFYIALQCSKKKKNKKEITRIFDEE